MKQIQGKRQLVRVIGRFEKPRVREIGILLYMKNSLSYSGTVLWNSLHCDTDERD